MSSINNKDEQMEVHIKSRNKVLSELKQACTKNSYHQTSNTDNSICDVPRFNEELCSPVVDDLLKEMNSRRLRNFEGNSSTNCYRCKQLSNIPPNLSETYDKISDSAEVYEADLNFVQAIVWLKSATASMKDISVEQFHLIFHKQWSNNLYTREDSESQSPISQKHDSESIISTIILSDNEENDAILDSDLEYTSSIEFLCNVRSKRNNQSRSTNQWEIKEPDQVFTGIPNVSSTFDSSQSFERSLITQKTSILKNCIIPDSDETNSSSSDMFKESLDDDDNNLERLKENEELFEEDLIQEFLLTSQDINRLQKTILETKCDFIITPNEGALSSASDTTMFDANSGCVSECYKRTNTQQSRVINSNLRNKNSPSLNKIVDIGSEEDSDYDTPKLSSGCTSNYILQDEDINKEADIITPYQKDSAYDTYNFEIPLTAMISDENRLFSLSSHHGSEESLNLTSVDFNINRDTPSSSENEYLERETDRIEDKQCNVKKRKLEAEYEMPRKKGFIDKNEKEEEKISSKWLRFTLDASNADDVAFQSVKIILSVLQNERLAERYMRKRCWKNTLEEEAVNAVLNFCDVFQAENKTVVCTQEIVQSVTDTLDKCIRNSELNKVLVSTHQVSIILELCNSAKVCVETINYLTTKLKSYESILIALMNGKKADVHNTINQLHVIFYALNICLQKYRLIFPDEQTSQFEEETIPSVVDLWKKQLTFEDAVIEDKMKTRERRWLIILDDFMVVSVENCSQFTDKLRMLIGLITRE